VELRDQYNNVVIAPAGGVVLGLGSSSLTGRVFAATINGSSISTITIPAGSSSVSFYYGDTKASSITITVSGTGLTSAVQIQSITAGAASAFLITSTALSGVASATANLGTVTVRLRDSFGNPAVAPTGGVTANLTSNTTGIAVFSTSLNGTAVTSLTFPAAAIMRTFFYGDTKAGSPTLTVSAPGFTSATQTATITAAATARLAFGQQPTNTPRGAGLPQMTAVTQDSWGNPTTTSGVTVTIFIATNGGLLGLLGVLYGTPKTAVTSGGVATFAANTLNIDGALLGLGATGPGYALGVSATGLTTGVSSQFAIT